MNGAIVAGYVCIAVAVFIALLRSGPCPLLPSNNTDAAAMNALAILIALIIAATWILWLAILPFAALLYGLGWLAGKLVKQ